MIRGQAWTTGLAAGLVVGMALTGCGSRAADQDASRTSTAPAVTDRATEPNPGETMLPAPPASQPLPTECENVLTTTEVDTVLGHPLPGTTEFIKGLAERGIGRTGRVTCRYGVAVSGTSGPSDTASGSRPAPASGTAPGASGPLSSPSRSTAPGAAAEEVVPIEVGLSAYRDADSAAGRIDFTIHDQQARGAKATDATILGINGILLTSPGTSMLALSYGTLTLALSIDPRIVPTGQLGRVAAALGKAVLRHLNANTNHNVPG